MLLYRQEGHADGVLCQSLLIMPKKPLVISLGGSLIYPQAIDAAYLKKFRQVVLGHIKKTGQQVIIVTGGGKICRDYNAAARDVLRGIPPEELDWLGIRCTKVNAELLRIILEDKATVYGGTKPGQSSDGAAVFYAKKHGAESIINLSNIAHVYSADPKKDKKAQKLEKLSWPEFRRIVGDKWDPGANFPFDPIAAKRAQRYKMKVVVAAGKDLPNFKKILQKKPFQGTTME